MKKFALALPLLAAVLVLAGCSGPASAPGSAVYGYYADTVTLPDGREVICVAVSQGGVACDWDHAR